MAFEISIHVDGFEGTLELLVLKVRGHELDIIDIRLAGVARQAADAALASPETAAFEPFLHIARLMWLKSSALLPGSDMLDELERAELEIEPLQAEEEPTEVRERLRDLYNVFRLAAESFRDRERDTQLRVHPSETRGGAGPEFYDEISFVEEVTPFDLMVVMNQVLRAALRGRTLRVNVDSARLLAMRIAEVFDFVFSRRGNVRFSDMITDGSERTEVALTFLAVIYLITQGRLAATQRAAFGEILVNVRESNKTEL